MSELKPTVAAHHNKANVFIKKSLHPHFNHRMMDHMVIDHNADIYEVLHRNEKYYLNKFNNRIQQIYVN